MGYNSPILSKGSRSPMKEVLILKDFHLVAMVIPQDEPQTRLIFNPSILILPRVINMQFLFRTQGNMYFFYWSTHTTYNTTTTTTTNTMIHFLQSQCANNSVQLITYNYYIANNTSKHTVHYTYLKGNRKLQKK